jgi:hypothetical protein
MNGRTISKIYLEGMKLESVDWIRLAQSWGQMSGPSEHYKDIPFHIKYGESLESVNGCKLFKKNSAP